jgi:hypothetical protein
MFTWVAQIHLYPSGVKEYHFANRPVISSGDGEHAMMRLAAADIEYWLPNRMVKGIRIAPVAERGLLEIFDQKDLADLQMRAVEFARSEDPDIQAIGEILHASVDLYRAVKEFLEELESQREEQTDESPVQA